ncbi:MAG: ATP-binding cassette domain-containing protein [Planctomycetes bacterium]|nr:ATP-binding cassette domain-containing protein [Planctomycetota bacterium]
MKLELRNVSKFYRGKKVALSNVTLRLESPGLVGLVGPNGAGKSTLMKLLTANLIPSQGEVLLNDNSLIAQEKKLKASLGYLPQEFGLFEDLTTAQFLDYMAALKQLKSGSIRSEIDRVIEATNLQEKRHARIRTLSGGQKQRVGIAQALLGDPELMILDEPTVGLDPAERVAFRNLFSKNAHDKLVILSTHIIEDVQSVCNRLLVLDKSVVLYDGTPEGLMERQGEASLEAAYMRLMSAGGKA